MSDDKKAGVDSETILMTLDQIGQTLDIMTSMIGRLRGHIEHHNSVDGDTTTTLTPKSQTLH